MHNKIGSITGVAGFIISLISLYFSYQATLDRKENLRVSLNAQRFGYETEIKAPVADIIPPLLKTNWDVVVTNNSDRKTTILESDVYLLGDKGRKDYSGLFQGLYQENGNKVSFPISLESGDYLKLRAVIGYEVAPKAYAELKQVDGFINNSFHIDDMHQFLCNHQIDFRDNDALCQQGIISISDNSSNKLYIMQLSTSRDNVFETAGFWYKVTTTY
ncbi:hypothetical protein P3744_27450 [Vibrio parahaemolyticus]|nr:hypothetical protein [Vibrio parahaemolyticus]